MQFVGKWGGVQSVTNWKSLNKILISGNLPKIISTSSWICVSSVSHSNMSISLFCRFLVLLFFLCFRIHAFLIRGLDGKLDATAGKEEKTSSKVWMSFVQLVPLSWRQDSMQSVSSSSVRPRWRPSLVNGFMFPWSVGILNLRELWSCSSVPIKKFTEFLNKIKQRSTLQKGRRLSRH